MYPILQGHLSEIEQLKMYLEHIKLQMENKLRQKRKQLEEELEAEYSRYKNYLEQHFLRIKERLECDLKMGTNGEDLTCSELLSVSSIHTVTLYRFVFSLLNIVRYKTSHTTRGMSKGRYKVEHFIILAKFDHYK